MNFEGFSNTVCDAQATDRGLFLHWIHQRQYF